MNDDDNEHEHDDDNEHEQIVTDPMDLTRMSKKLAGDKYPTISSILDDMILIRDNAHAYNTGKCVCTVVYYLYMMWVI
jgi:hypothetical protein